MLQIGFGWAAFGIVAICTVLLNIIIIKYYSDKHQSEKFTTIVSIIGLTTALLCVMIIPVDILNVSTMSNSLGNITISQNDIDQRNLSLRIFYYAFYGFTLLFALVMMPFAYFYYEEEDEASGVTTGARILGACKYTSFTIVFAIVLFIVGAFIRPGSNKPVDNQNAKDWLEQELLNQNAAVSSMIFAIACLTILGFLVWFVFTAFGLSAFPIGLIKGRRRVSDDRHDITENIYKTREKANYYSSKYASGKAMSANEEQTLSLLKSKERVLQKHSSRLDASNSGIRKILVVVRPFTFIFGFIFLLISLLLIISIVLSIIDKLSSSVCGAACGFLTDYPKLKNPIDLMLSASAPYFPLDYILLGLLILYVYIATLSGIVKIGIRFLWIKLYEFTPSRTAPQALLIASVILMLSNLCLNIQIVQLAPQYAMFGTQVWYNVTSNAIESCTINAPPSACVMTQIGLLISRVEMGTSFFGVIFYYATWGIVAAFIIGSIISIIRKPKSNIVAYGDDSDEEI
ncbi:hypothetical protein SAMD00019534_011090 [Acytostelium subglobosum LB1]|uniref:hypothetical protein n=1 Tax=Acytostelium subglobosum LB1 TaxID=1410327 RepID=UPI000644D374|nr:hypothetical protein SAMD00019534_011090 [Acytostelium subglobosum LB1]GAM17934.1 hypothetical protein SAMD00019534_011090 [Acytostelium subglobosum LB1]|eukprot:XP_012758530.1 hypothetical protein SAMD00019534_011090 [Acytostelium subglobosum LB1]